jgi:hypothetical protein
MHFYEGLKNGEISLLSGLQFTTIKANEVIEPKEEIVFSLDIAQELMDGLWQCGLRPSEGTGSAGALKATENHLKDMQTIVFKLLDREGK